jgi:hypothetical protein
LWIGWANGTHLAATITVADAYTNAQLLRSRVWVYHGYPEEIVTDRDPPFVNQCVKALHTLAGCKPALSTAYHPQSDVQTEPIN